MKRSAKISTGRQIKLGILDDAAGALSAAKWLIDENYVRSMTFQCTFRRLIYQKKSDYSWRVDERLLKQYFKKKTHLSKSSPDSLATLLCGLGELVSRTNADLLSPTVAWIRRFRPLINAADIMRDAAQLKAARPTPSTQIARGRTVQSLATVNYVFSLNGLSPELWNVAKSIVAHRQILMPSMRYGLGFVARVMLRIDPKGLMRWARGKATSRDQWTVLEMLEHAVTWCGPEVESIGRALLRTQDPLCTMLAARVLVAPPFQGTAPPLSATWIWMIHAGVSNENACWLCAPCISDNAQQLDSLGRQMQQLEKRRADWDASPSGGVIARNTVVQLDAEIRTVKSNIAAAELARDTLLPVFADMLRQSDISADKWRLIFQELPRSLRARHALADEIGHSEARRRILANIVGDLHGILGDRESVTSNVENFSIERSAFFEVSNGAAQATIALADDSKKNIGRQAAQGISELVEAAKEVLAEPYLRLRQYSRWHSAMGRYASAVSFAFAVAEAVPEDRRSEISRLVRNAIDHAIVLLGQVPEPFHDREWWFQHLTVRVIRWLNVQCLLDEIEAAGQNAELPSFVRTLALWSNPAVARKYQDLALEQFLRACSRWPGEMTGPKGLERAIVALDIAIGCCGTDAVVDDLEAHWHDVVATWGSSAELEWSAIAGQLIKAIRADGPERIQFLADQRFVPSCCRASIESA